MSPQTRMRRLGVSFLAGLLALSALLLITSLTWAKPTGTIIVNPGDSIQAAIDAANPGDTILINAGTYTESLTLNKAVSLTGVSRDLAIINALANQRVLTVTGAAISNSVVISGLTFANGHVTDSGGGMLATNNALPLIENVVFINNYAGDSGGGLAVDTFEPVTLTNILAISNTAARGGGGVSAMMATVYGGRFIGNHSLCISYPCGGGGLTALDLTISGAEFRENTATHTGGGVSTNVAIITGAQFISNNSLEGGGLWVFAGLVLADSKFVSNSANNEGGGLYVLPDGFAKVVNTEFSHNTAEIGGGVTVGRIILTGGRFEANRATESTYAFDGGGGLSVYDSFDITGTEFVNNSAYHGGGIFHSGINTGRIVNTLFIQNRAEVGGAAVWTSSPSNTQILFTTIASPTLSNVSAIAIVTGNIGITNTIIASYTIGIENVGGDVYEDYNLFHGNTQNLSGTVTGGTHDVFGNPNFANPALGNYHVISPSAAIDVGVNAGITADLDGIHRPVGAGFDIGAYEYINFTSWIYLPLVRR